MSNALLVIQTARDTRKVNCAVYRCALVGTRDENDHVCTSRVEGSSGRGLSVRRESRNCGSSRVSTTMVDVYPIRDLSSGMRESDLAAEVLTRLKTKRPERDNINLARGVDTSAGNTIVIDSGCKHSHSLSTITRSMFRRKHAFTRRM